MEVRDVVKMLFRRAWIVFPVLATCLACAWLGLSFMTPVFRSSIRLMVAGSPHVESQYYTPAPPSRRVSIARTAAEIVHSQDILRAVALTLRLQDRDEEQYYSSIKRWTLATADRLLEDYRRIKEAVRVGWLGLAPTVKRPGDPLQKAVERLEKRIVVEDVEETDIIRVTVDDYDPDTSARIGNALARHAILFVLSQEDADLATRYGARHPMRAQLLLDLSALKAEIAGNPSAPLARDLSSGYLKVVQSAYPPTKPASPKRNLVYIASVVGALVGSLLLMLLLEQLDPTCRDVEDVRESLGLPVLGSIPSSLWSSRLPFSAPAPLDVDRFLSLAYQLQSLRARCGARSLLIVTPERSRSGLRLAQALAACLGRVISSEGEGGGVLLVQQELNGGKFLGEPIDPARRPQPLSEFLAGRGGVEKSFYEVEKGLSLSAIRGAARAGVARDARCREFLEEAKSRFELVLVEGRDSGGDSDAVLLGSHCDAAVVVVDEKSSRRMAAQRLLERFRLNEVRVLGAIVNEQRRPLPGPIYRAV